MDVGHRSAAQDDLKAGLGQALWKARKLLPLKVESGSFIRYRVTARPMVCGTPDAAHASPEASTLRGGSNRSACPNRRSSKTVRPASRLTRVRSARSCATASRRCRTTGRRRQRAGGRPRAHSHPRRPHRRRRQGERGGRRHRRRTSQGTSRPDSSDTKRHCGTREGSRRHGRNQSPPGPHTTGSDRGSRPAWISEHRASPVEEGLARATGSAHRRSRPRDEARGSAPRGGRAAPRTRCAHRREDAR